MSNVIKYLVCLLLVFSCSTKKEETVDLEHSNVELEMVADLTSPPYVPKPTAKRKAKKLIVDMEIVEKEMELSDGVKYVFWTFGGTVPGSFIRAKVGDEIMFTLKNHPDNKLPHNIDLHAVNGPGGGAESSFVAPGYEKTFSFKTLNPGLFVYHCATAPVGMHIANGMYGLILVEPEEGLPPVDKEYYIMQGDFYTKGKTGERGLQPFDMEKAMAEEADYVVFNGNTGSMVGKNAITAKAGETVRLYVGNGGPNLVSSFHVIGEIFDRVHVEGGDLINENVQTTLIPAGGAAIVEFKVNVPGSYVLLDHSVFRAFNKGALAQLQVSGDENLKVFSGELREGIYQPEGGTIQELPSNNQVVPPPAAMDLEDQMTYGKQVYMTTCFACHQAEGQGIENVFPPLAASDYLNDDVDRSIKVVLQGLQGEITVNGATYNNVMPSQGLTDEEIANVLTYIYHSWDNSKVRVTPEMVAKIRAGE
ncbi:copper-containing nitrite reductase [Galbibacter sp.]|uniref:copper-containing nitrite reductase n=1 Tax=Galbibacter sp. TaxID=2918471 RepID=UPI002C239A0B|nr:copper-containing nitrite reductase [Galbibacter sp.]HLV62000.1 copper-containing nitrite reductase [Galbibacter sp.]